ncbi:hypothetical protein [Cytobacillus sp. NCCP-133]|uniref:hypothetical protein n=1 Tax=Cytobacillus sp. NCCP-133 TaxID=766848 RepID=UPI0022316D92|nr:hypothetical protein [Cytobacillus sp. NCCP-133]GLB60096.1 hypothetical protein NCCP133_22280 [Cytobacillus sp. NCCP-133]
MEQLTEIEQRREFQFAIYENNKKQLFQLLLLGIIGTGAGYYLGEELIWKLTLGMGILAAAGYGITSYKLGKWLKNMPEKRRLRQ